MSLMEELYKEAILKHYKYPSNYGFLPDATLSSTGHNSSCGDHIELSLKLSGDRIEGVSFSGQGCAISKASASMMTEVIKGKSIEETRALSKSFKAMVIEGSNPDGSLGELAALSGVSKLHARVKCATLAWNTLEELLSEAQSGISL